jgi:hypothetical protein
MRKIKAWSLTIVWDDDEVENNVDVPYYASKVIDEFLDELQEEYHQNDLEAENKNGSQ